MRTILSVLTMGVFGSGLVAGQTDPSSVATIADFMSAGAGSAHEKAPAEIVQFGRLAGVWHVDVELRRRDGGWQEGAPGIWAWKYALDGLAVTDLWYQPASALPIYMKDLGRDYLLTSNRVYDVSSSVWRVAWMANGAGAGPGADFGTFDAELDDGAIEMRSPNDGMGLQRVVFDAFTTTSFHWKSEYSSDDGKTWQTVMRMVATRIEE